MSSGSVEPVPQELSGSETIELQLKMRASKVTRPASTRVYVPVVLRLGFPLVRKPPGKAYISADAFTHMP
jgi:hypothetical protein